MITGLGYLTQQKKYILINCRHYFAVLWYKGKTVMLLLAVAAATASTYLLYYSLFDFILSTNPSHTRPYFDSQSFSVIFTACYIYERLFTVGLLIVFTL